MFDIDDTFFDGFEETEIKKGNVKVETRLNKKVNLLEFDFYIKGVVSISCDRCLDDFEMQIESENKLFVKFGEQFEEQTDEIITLSFEEHEIDLSQFIYEYIHLSLPYRRVHPDDENGESLCNKEMLKKLEEYSVREEEHHDPRWDDLKNLYMNNN